MQLISDHRRDLRVDYRSLLCLAGLALVLAALYWPAVSLQGIFYVGDIFRLNYPARALYAEGLRSGRIPLWTPDALAGYPILAEGQTGAYYPLNLLLYRWLPLPAALNYSVLLSLWVAGAGAFLYARALGLRRLAGFLAGCTFMLGGFLPAHLNHLNILAGVAWLPFLLWAVERAVRNPSWRAWALVAAFFGVQGLAGHPQVSLLSAMLAGAQALVGPLGEPAARLTPRRQISQLAFCSAALLAGAALAAVQWGPTYQLMRLSQREGGLDYGFFTSFSLSPDHLITLLWPFAQGNPYPLVSQEMVGYAGILPLGFALLAPVRRRSRAVVFWSVVVLLAVALALGRFNPAYRLLQHVPLLNAFRAPARYLLWLDLAVAILAAVAFDSFLALARPVVLRWHLLAPAIALPTAAVVAAGLSRAPLERLLLDWHWLPLAWLGATVALLVTLYWRPPAQLWAALVIALVLADLGAFNGVHNQTYNDVMPPAEFLRPPAALAFLRADAGPQPYRIYTGQNWPGLPVMRESFYPNIQLLYGVQSLNGYFPLVPGRQQWLFDNLNPRLLDLLNVRYVLVPQHLPASGETDFFITENPFASSLVGRCFDLPARPVAALEVEGFLTHSAGLPVGAPVGEIILRGAGGEELVWTLRAGRELAEWSGSVAPEQGQVVRTWPEGFTPAGGLGRTYLAHWALPRVLEVRQVEVRALIPPAHLHLERLRLIDSAGQGQPLAALAGQADHILVYCSPGVAIYRNESAGPRARLVHRARLAHSEEEARRLMMAPTFDPRQEVILLAGQELAGDAPQGESVAIEAYEAEYVRLRAVVASQAYLVLADSDYPGWIARIDGRPAPIYRADVALRAVALPPGEHVVEFQFAPQSCRLGQWVSAVSCLALAVAVLKRG